MGVDIKNSFEVNFYNAIKKIIAENNLSKYEVIEINNAVDIKFYKYCLSLSSDVIENGEDERVILKHKLILLGIKMEDARLIALKPVLLRFL